MAQIAEIADAVTKILSVGASGFAVVLASMTFLLIKQPPTGHTDAEVVVYRERLRAGLHFLMVTLAFFVIALVGQYFLDKRETRIELGVQESAMLQTIMKDFDIKPIVVTYGDSDNEIPTKAGKGRLAFIIRGDGRIDISLNALIDHIQNQGKSVRQLSQQIATRTNQGGFDENR